MALGIRTWPKHVHTTQNPPSPAPDSYDIDKTQYDCHENGPTNGATNDHRDTHSSGGRMEDRGLRIHGLGRRRRNEAETQGRTAVHRPDDSVVVCNQFVSSSIRVGVGNYVCASAQHTRWSKWNIRRVVVLQIHRDWYVYPSGSGSQSGHRW
jgi:hypothetical protein